MGPLTWISTHPGQPGYIRHWVTSLPTVEANTEPLIWHHSWEGQLAAWCRLIILSSFHHGRAAFCSYWYRHYSWYWYTFSVHMLPSKLPLIDLTIASFTVMHFAWHCFWSRNSLNRKGSIAVGPCSCHSLVLPCCVLSRSGCFERMEEWTFEDSVVVPNRWHIFQGWDKVL